MSIVYWVWERTTNELKPITCLLAPSHPELLTCKCTKTCARNYICIKGGAVLHWPMHKLRSKIMLQRNEDQHEDGMKIWISNGHFWSSVSYLWGSVSRTWGERGFSYPNSFSSVIFKWRSPLWSTHEKRVDGKPASTPKYQIALRNCLHILIIVLALCWYVSSNIIYTAL